MNGQQLFFCFLPGVTLSVLTSYPSLANTVKVGEPQLVMSPTSVIDSIYLSKQNNLPRQIAFDNSFATKSITINQQSLFQFDDIRAIDNPTSSPKGNLFASSPKDLLRAIKNQRHTLEKTDNDTNLLLTKVGLYGEEDQGLNFTDFDFGADSLPMTKISSVVSVKSDSNKVKLSESIASLANKKPILAPTLTIDQLPAKNIGASMLKPKPVSKETELIGQNPTGGQQPPAKIPPSTLPATGRQVPNYLNSNPNPLQFPTKPEEVRISGTQPITLSQALEIARRNNRELQIALLQVERSQAAVREAQAALLPSVGLTAGLARQGSGNLGGNDANNPFQQSQDATNFSGNAQLNYDLYTSGNRRAIIRQAEEQLRSDELNLETQSEAINLQVTNQYYDLQQADESVRINESAVINAQASLRDALALERAGVGTRFDVLQFQVDLANSRQLLTNAIAEQQIAQRQLAETLSVPQAINLSAADPVQLAGLWNQTLEQSIIQALQNRPELRQNLAQRNIAEQQRRQALSQLGPQVSLVATYGLSDQFENQLPSNYNYSVGVQARLNLYEGGAARARAAQASSQIAIAENQFANQRNQIRFEVERAYVQLGSNLQNVQTANTALEQAREALRLARLRFQAGVGTQTDVINAQNRLTQSEGNRVTAILNYNRALATIQRAVTLRGTR